jgi:membrane-bound lytic murein transglycosylase C
MVISSLAFTGAFGVTAAYAAQDPFAELDQATSQYVQTPAQKQKEMSEFEKYKARQISEYQAYKRKLMAEFAEYKRISTEETAKYQKDLAKVWNNPEVSSKKVWVDYSADMKKRSRVDFENNTLTLQVVLDKKAQYNDQEMKKALADLITENKAEAFKRDVIAQGIEKRSKQKISLLKTATVNPTPILIPYLTGSDKVKKGEVNAIVDNMLAKKKESKSTNKEGKKVVTIVVPLTAPEKVIENTNNTSGLKKPKVMAELRLNKLPRKARTLNPTVQKYAKQVNLDDALVFAIIETESAFNPMARSAVPAYGLMQIVPNSAGQDATQELYGRAKILSPSYLYNGHNNIKIGATYLKIVYYRYFKGIKNPTSRLYCTIAAYNTGAGNVAKAFVGKRKLTPAIREINRMTPQQVYNKLIADLPYEETQNYLKRVTRRMPKYEI